MKPQVLTSTTSASSALSDSCQPPSSRRAASSSESTSFLAQPRVTRLTLRLARTSSPLDDTPADYGKCPAAGAPAQAPHGRAGTGARRGGQPEVTVHLVLVQVSVTGLIVLMACLTPLR